MFNEWSKSRLNRNLFTSCRRKEDAMSASFRRHDMRSTRDPHEIQVIPQRPAELFVVVSSEHRPIDRDLGSPPCRSAAEPLRQYWAHVGRSSSQRQRSQVRDSERLLSLQVVSIYFHCGILRSLWSLWWKRRVWTKLSHWKSFRIIETETIVSFHLALAFPHQWAQRR